MEEAFLAAVRAGDVLTVRRLLDKHPLLASARDADGASAVRVALSHGHGAVADELLAAGPDLDVFDAAAVGRDRVVRIALDLEPALAEAWSPDGFQAIHLAAFFGHLDCVRTLLAAGAPVDGPAQHPIAVRPLHAAAAGPDPAARLAIAVELLDAGASPGSRQPGGFTPLHAAAQHGDDELAIVLVARGADARDRTDDGRSAADLAVAAGHLALGARLTVP